MTFNLLSETWTNLDLFELRLLLDKRIGGPGQYDGLPNNLNKLYLPLAGSSCRIVLTFRNKKIITIEPGPAFDLAEWERVSEEIEQSILHNNWNLQSQPILALGLEIDLPLHKRGSFLSQFVF